MNKNTIGITGSSSFLGQNLLHKLKHTNKKINIFRGDIRNPAEVVSFVKDCDIIYHLAGYNRGTDEDVYTINILGGANIVSAAVTIGNRYIIFPSSDYLLRYPNNSYSISKKAIENSLMQINNINNCRISIIRLPNIYGPLALPFHVSVVATFSWYEANGMGDKMPIIGDGSRQIELIPVNEVIDYFVKLLQNRKSLKQNNEMKGEKFTIKELSEIIHSPTKRKVYPIIDETIEFFLKPIKLKIIKEKKSYFSNQNNFIFLLDPNQRPLLKKIKILKLLPGYQRNLYHTISDNCWISINRGIVALDIFTHNDNYENTILLDKLLIKNVELISNYKYKFRNLGNESVDLIFYKQLDEFGI